MNSIAIGIWLLCFDLLRVHSGGVPDVHWHVQIPAEIRWTVTTNWMEDKTGAGRCGLVQSNLVGRITWKEQQIPVTLESVPVMMIFVSDFAGYHYNGNVPFYRP